MKKILTLVLFIHVAVFSYWLMNHSLSQDQSGLLIGGKYWSDFGAQLPLIRSFSLGENWPPEHPLFPGEPIKYHFLFYLLVSAWESLGVPLHLSLNIPSAFGLFSLAVFISILSYKFFRSYLVSFLSTLFIFFNGSLSWVEFIKKYSFSELFSLNSFPAFGPWNGSTIAAFWNLNIYTNQRHLALSFSLVVLLLYFLVSRKNTPLIFTGSIIGVLLLLNQPAAVIATIFAGSFFLFEPRVRKPLIVSIPGGLLFLLIYFFLVASPNTPSLSLGFLQTKPITILSFINYWFANFGLHLLLIPLGLMLSIRKSKAFIIPLLILFIAPNIWQFSPDIINNHKFFNFYLIIGGIFSAYAISRLKLFGLLLIPFVILGGLVDFFPIKNDIYYSLPDYKQNADVAFFVNQTPKNSVILNSTWFYHPASLAGRRIFNGYSYFTWSYGYDQVTREADTVTIYSAPDKATACRLLNLHSIDFVDISREPESFIAINRSLWLGNFEATYVNPLSGYYVIDVKKQCP